MTETAATTGGSVLRGGVWYTAARIIPQLYALAISVVAARFLGPEGMGRQSFIAFVELSLAALLTQGIFLALMRSVGETVGRGDRAALRGLLAWAWKVELLLALGGGAIIASIALAGAEPRNAWLLAAAICAIATLHSVPSAVLIGVQRWRQASIVGLSTGVVGTIATVGVLVAGGGITGMFAVEAVISVANLIWSGYLARRAVGQISGGGSGGGAAGALRRQVVGAAAILTISEILVLIVERRSEIFFLERNSADSEIALYSIVFSVVTALAQVPYAMALAVSPAVATLFGAGSVERIRFGYARALRLLVVSALPLTAVGIAVGPALLRVVYGEEYEGTRPILLIMMAIFPLIPLAGLASSLLTGIGRLRLLLAASAAAAAIDVTLAVVLTSRFHAVGAAIANATAQFVLTGLLLLFVYWLAGSVDLQPAPLARAAVAAAASGLVGWTCIAVLGDTVGVAVGSAASLGLFLVLAAALRILPRRDAAWLEQTVGRYWGG